MRLLLDTQTFLWIQTAPERFSKDALAVVHDAGNDLLLSAASSWEIGIKYALGRLHLPTSPSEYVPERMRRSDIAPMPVEHAHALRAAELPLHSPGSV